MEKQLNLIYALKDNSIVSISEVENGLKCGCICPACGEQLVAKKGKKRIHHFAHYSGNTCSYGYESSLHLAAKDILSKARKMTVPPVYVHFPDSNKKDELISKAREIEIDSVELEKQFGCIVPDVIVHAGGKTFFIEVYVTHCIDEVKLEKLRESQISTIEIDLSKKNSTISVDELTKILIDDSDEKQWKYNRLSEVYLKKFIAVADNMEITSRGFAMHVDGCPIRARTWRGKPYANYIDDCLGCKYCISNADGLLCSGRSRIATINDFSIPEQERLKASNIEQQEEKELTFSQGRCPNCGNLLVKRQSKYGTFLGCSNYPHCRFTASTNPESGEIITKA